MKKCRYCGRESLDNAEFCKNCGKAFDDTNANRQPTANQNKKYYKIFGIVIILALFAGALFVKNASLNGDDLIAYNLVANCRNEFDKPFYVKSGTLCSEKDCFFAVIVSETADGEKERYCLIKEEGIFSSDLLGENMNVLCETKALNYNKINRKLKGLF